MGCTHENNNWFGALVFMEDYRDQKGAEQYGTACWARGQPQVCAVWEPHCVTVLCRESCSSAPTPCSSCVPCRFRAPSRHHLAHLDCVAVISAAPALCDPLSKWKINCVLLFITLCHCSSSNSPKVIISASAFGYENWIPCSQTVNNYQQVTGTSDLH